MRTVANPLPAKGGERRADSQRTHHARWALCYGTLQMPEVKHLAQVYRQVIL